MHSPESIFLLLYLVYIKIAFYYKLVKEIHGWRYHLESKIYRNKYFINPKLTYSFSGCDITRNILRLQNV